MWLCSSMSPGNTVPPVSSTVTPSNPAGAGSPRLRDRGDRRLGDPHHAVAEDRRSRVHCDYAPAQRPPGARCRVDRPGRGTAPRGLVSHGAYRTLLRGDASVTHTFDPGPIGEPYASLVAAYPGPDVYPPDSFRVEWGPIFHRGRLDGTARLLVIGQDPAQSEAIVRRILVGEAGHRTQGLMAKLGFDRRATCWSIRSCTRSTARRAATNTRTTRGSSSTATAGCGRSSASNQIEAVLALGGLADDAWQKWKQTPVGQGYSPAYQHVTHPTAPESERGRRPGQARGGDRRDAPELEPGACRAAPADRAPRRAGSARALRPRVRARRPGRDTGVRRARRPARVDALAGWRGRSARARPRRPSARRSRSRFHPGSSERIAPTATAGTGRPPRGAITAESCAIRASSSSRDR